MIMKSYLLNDKNFKLSRKKIRKQRDRNYCWIWSKPVASILYANEYNEQFWIKSYL